MGVIILLTEKVGREEERKTRRLFDLSPAGPNSLGNRRISNHVSQNESMKPFILLSTITSRIKVFRIVGDLMGHGKATVFKALAAAKIAETGAATSNCKRNSNGSNSINISENTIIMKKCLKIQFSRVTVSF